MKGLLRGMRGLSMGAGRSRGRAGGKNSNAMRGRSGQGHGGRGRLIQGAFGPGSARGGNVMRGFLVPGLGIGARGMRRGLGRGPRRGIFGMRRPHRMRGGKKAQIILHFIKVLFKIELEFSIFVSNN